MSHSSKNLTDDESQYMTVKVVNGLDNLVWINKKKTTMEGCQVFITPRDSSSLRGRKVIEEEDKNHHHHHHNYKYKLYKNYYHILSFLLSFIYSTISTFFLLLLANKVSIIIFSDPPSFTSFHHHHFLSPFLGAPLSLRKQPFNLFRRRFLIQKTRLQLGFIQWVTINTRITI